ncbi:MAG: hypothetical protein KGI33_07470 [Thaumarchaeota archaeon]|nr:hypothetical protein [Nitrososphaerota archaeon]
MKKLEMPYLLLITILGSVTITAVLAETDTTITTYPYVVTDGSNQRLVIISSGNVGISTASPLTRLDLGPNPSLFLEGNGNQWGFTINSTDYGNGNVPLTFTSRGSGINTEVMRITHSGNVGIGTATPLQKLDVAGGINLAGNITSRTNNEFTITAPVGIPICIGTC